MIRKIKTQKRITRRIYHSPLCETPTKVARLRTSIYGHVQVRKGFSCSPLAVYKALMVGRNESGPLRVISMRMLLPDFVPAYGCNTDQNHSLNSFTHEGIRVKISKI